MMEGTEENGSMQQDKAAYAAPEKKKKRIQYCTFCKNHNIQAPKKDHLCPFKQCNCSLCELQRRAQVSMRHQQRVWRHQKHKLAFGKFHDVTNVLMEKGQVCDKCRNHNKIVMKKNHQCPHNDCTCEYCSLTFKRRELMKHLQRVRRSKITFKKDAVPTPQEKRQEKESEKDGPFTTEGTPLQNVHLEQESPTPPSSSGYPEEQSCSSWSDDNWCSLSPDASSVNGLKEDVFEEAEMDSPSPCVMQSRTPGPHSPPPLIPLTQNYHIHHPHTYMSRGIVNEASQIEMAPQIEICEKQSRSPPLLCPMHHEHNQIPLIPPQRVSQIQRTPSSDRHSLMERDSREYYTLDTSSTSAACITQYGSHCSDHQHYVRKFGVTPEDFCLRQFNWQSSSTDSKTPDSDSPPPLMVVSNHQMPTYSNRSQESVYPNNATEGKGMLYFYNRTNHFANPSTAYPHNLSIVKRIYKD